MYGNRSNFDTNGIPCKQLIIETQELRDHKTKCVAVCFQRNTMQRTFTRLSC